MFKRFTLVHCLVLCILLIIASAVYIIILPSANNQAFNKDAASFDTTSFYEYGHGEVSKVIYEQVDEGPRNKVISQQVEVLLTDTDRKGELIITDHTSILDKAGSVQYKVGDKVILGAMPGEVAEKYVIIDRDRMAGIYFIIALFILLAIVVGRLKGITSLVGLSITGAILLLFIAPQILNGKDPFLVSIVGAGMIVLVSMFISHGFSKRIQVSAISTLASLALSAGVAYVAIYTTQLFGFGQSDAFLLETGYLGNINLRGILLAGIVISVLGVLDDVTTTQTAAIDELYQTNPNLTLKELYKKGLSIGREHIASLINTLILVYAGAALPLFLLLTLQKSQPIWVVLNSEFIAEELVRSLIGSSALIIAVPLSTLLAAYIYTRKTPQ